MIRVGIIGFGQRVSRMARLLGMFDIPCRIAAVADPRAEVIQASHDPLLKDTEFYSTADELLANAGDLDGVMVGTRCHLHTEMACKVARVNLPLYLEKPVAISFAQVRQLEQAFTAVSAPVVVAFNQRTSYLARKVKEIIDSGQLGTVEQVVAFNDVPYGTIYYRTWYRNYEETGGLFLQKATHDLDYINYFLDQRPKWISAQKALRVFGGDKPFDLKCEHCSERQTCPESPFVRFHRGFEGERVEYDHEYGYCVFSQGFELEDMGSCLIEYANGAQASYHQNFFVRYKAARRGARLYGYRGTLEFDWYQNQIRVFSHSTPVVDTIDFPAMPNHWGGDRELCYEFLMAMRDRRPSHSSLSAGILSALMCLWARESANTRQVCEIKMPDG